MFFETFKVQNPEYKIEKITAENIHDVFNLFKENYYYFSHVQSHEVLEEECLKDIKELPPGKTLKDKTYMIIYRNKLPVAVIDFVMKYPDEETGYLGLFILACEYQGKGEGTKLLRKVINAAKEQGINRIELGCHMDNELGFAFWQKQGFSVIRSTSRLEDGKERTIYSMEKRI